MLRKLFLWRLTIADILLTLSKAQLFLHSALCTERRTEIRNDV